MNASVPESNASAADVRSSDVALAGIKDPAVLSSVIERNRATLMQGWDKLDRLSAQLEKLNMLEKRIIQKDLQTPQSTVPPSAEISAAA
jgi:hypothetical protein